ncbi:MAG: hypothetical protein J1G38_01815 [Clostridiales bacterium]|nr:hypothetical protein [Clostridiales bacterium]
MAATKDQDRFVESGGGTGEHKYPDFKSAYKSVAKEDKRRAFIMLGAAGVTVAFMLMTRLLWLFEPVWDYIYYGTLSEIVYYIVLGLLCTGFIIALNIFIKHYCEVRLFKRKEHGVSIARALGAIAVAAAAVLIVNSTFGFTFKVQKEMGVGVTMATALTNIAVYFYYAFHMWLGFAAAALVQNAMSTLIPAKYTIPWGAIFLVTVYGLFELLFEYATTNHLYPLHYYFMTYAYAAIYMLTGRGFHVSYWASVIVMVL